MVNSCCLATPHFRDIAISIAACTVAWIDSACFSLRAVTYRDTAILHTSSCDERG